MIDAVIDLEWTRAMVPDKPDDSFIQPVDIAQKVWHLARQAKGTWSKKGLDDGALKSSKSRNA